MFKRLVNILLDASQLTSIMEVTVLVLISVTDVLGLLHCNTLQGREQPEIIRDEIWVVITLMLCRSRHS